MDAGVEPFSTGAVARRHTHAPPGSDASRCCTGIYSRPGVGTMTRIGRYTPVCLWAAQEVQRRAGRSILLFACLASLVLLCATSLLFSQAMDATWSRLMDAAPDLVVRRIDAGGWAALPADAAIASANTVPGVIETSPRIWGVVTGPDGPVTVAATRRMLPADLLQNLVPPRDGQAVVGQGVVQSLAVSGQGDRLTLVGAAPLSVNVVASFPVETGAATHDLVWLAPADARQLLGLAPGQASDLAIHLVRKEEEQAIQPDLAAAFPWPVRISDQSTSSLRHHRRAIRFGGIALVASIPALLAMLLIMVESGTGTTERTMRWGLLKSMGWSTTDILRLQVAQAVIVGLPAVATGMGCAYAMVFCPPLAGVTAYWVTGGMSLPALTLDPAGALQVMLEVGAMVALPYLTAVFLTTLLRAGRDPWSMLQENSWH